MIDLRSDTVTHPTGEMRKAMAEAAVGDDVYRDDPTMKHLETLAAKIIGKPAALFTVSGTMGNQLGVMTHTKRGNEIIAGKNCHIVRYEGGAPAILSQVGYSLVDKPDAYIRAADIRKALRSGDVHFPETGLLCLENALGDGRTVPMDIMEEASGAAHEYGIPVHLDGARIFNAAMHLGVEAKQIAACADSVMFCLSKGLCAPVGSILAGPEAFIERARRNRKLLGGGMRQAGILAAAGIIALEKMTGRLAEDHDNAKYLAEKLQALDFVECNPRSVHINMVFFGITKPGFDSAGYISHMQKEGIIVSGEVSPGIYRYVTHHGITKKDIDLVLNHLGDFLRK